MVYIYTYINIAAIIKIPEIIVDKLNDKKQQGEVILAKFSTKITENLQSASFSAKKVIELKKNLT